MKLLRSLLVLLLSISFFSGIVHAADSSNLKEMDYLKKIDLIHQDLKEGLSPTLKTGDLNSDFLNQLTQYHQGWITLAKNDLQYGERKALKEPINQIVHELKLNLNKISKLQKKLNENLIYDEAKEATYLSSYDWIYQQTLNELKNEGDVPTTLIGDSIDFDFLTRLAKQMEVFNSFVDNFTEQTENEQVKTLALEIQKEINELKNEVADLIKKISA